MTEQERADLEITLREERLLWRRQLAHDLALDMARRPQMGKTEFGNPAADVEDFANAVAERVWAREDWEIREW